MATTDEHISCASATKYLKSWMRIIVEKHIYNIIAKTGVVIFDLKHLTSTISHNDSRTTTVDTDMFFEYLTNLGYEHEKIDEKHYKITLGNNDANSAQHANNCDLLQLYDETIYPMMCGISCIYLRNDGDGKWFFTQSTKELPYCNTVQCRRTFSNWDVSQLVLILRGKSYDVSIKTDHNNRNMIYIGYY